MTEWNERRVVDGLRAHAAWMRGQADRLNSEADAILRRAERLDQAFRSLGASSYLEKTP